jgi:Ca2+-binding RTX toxin-like protein
MNGGGADDYIVAGLGSDLVDGGPGFDNAVYWDATGPIVADAGAGTVTGDGTDTLTSVERIDGGNFDDTLSAGTAASAQLGGGGGNDTVTGGSGGDILSGNAGEDVISGGGGDDLLDPGAGDDTVDGGAGFDGVGFWDAGGPITANLGTGTATGDGFDTFSNIEALHGSDFADTLIGGPGWDVIFGNRGDDALYGGAGNDFLDGGDGNDFADGGPDWDSCYNAETTVNCEVT